MRTLLLSLTALLLAGCDVLQEVARGSAPEHAYAQEVRMDTAGVVARRVLAGLEDNQVAPLPDGRSVIKNDWNFVSPPGWGFATGELVQYDLERGTTHRITHHNLTPSDPGEAFAHSVSPDGRLVAYHWESNQGFGPTPVAGAGPYRVEVRLVDVAGGTPRVMFTDDDWVEVRGWSPDGKSFMAVNEPDEGGPQLLRIPVDGGQPRLVRTLTSWPGLVEFTPDGRSLIYDRAVEVDDKNRDIYLLDLDAEREYAIIQSPADDRLLGWVPGSSNILFSSDRSGTTGVWSQHVENGRAEGAPVLVKPDFWRAEPIGFTKDGTFYYSVQSEGPKIWTATVDMATGAVGEAEPIPLPWPISGNRLLFGWSSEGRALSVLLNTELTVRSLSTGESRTYTSLPRYYPWGPMRWSADGSAIFWRARLDPRATLGLVRLDLGTGQARVFDVPVQGREEFNGFELLPDGNSAVVRRRIAPEFTADRQNAVRLSVLDLSTGAERELFEVRGSGLGFAVSPDGSRVAVSQLAPADRGPEVTPRGSFEYFVIPLSGAPEPRKVATGPVRSTQGFGFFWEPSGNAIIHITNADTEASGSGPLEGLVDRFALDGSPLQTIKLTNPEPSRGPGVLSPRADRLAFRAGEVAYELWALEGLPGSASAARPR